MRSRLLKKTLLILVISILGNMAFSMNCADIDLTKATSVLGQKKISQEVENRDYNTCQTASAARVIENYLSNKLGLAADETVSWMSLTLNARAYSLNLKNESLFSQKRALLPCDVIDHASRKGVCIQRNNKVDSYINPDQYVELRKEFKRYQNTLKEMKVSDGGDESIKLKNEFAERINCIVKKPDSNIENIKQIMDAMFSNQFLASLVDTECTRKTGPLGVKCESTVRKRNTEDYDSQLDSHLQNGLADGKPAMVTFCSSLRSNRSHMDNVVRNVLGIFTLMTDDPSCGLHTATIVGSKPYVDDKGIPQCKFLVQDTYGDDCNFGVPCKNGISEIDSKVLLLNTLEADLIK